MNQKRATMRKMRPKGRLHAIFGGGTSEEAAQVEALSLQVRRDQSSTLRTPEGRGGMMGYRLLRRPAIIWEYLGSFASICI